MRAKLKRISRIARTTVRLGLGNCVAVATHRVRLRSGRLQKELPITPFPVASIWPVKPPTIAPIPLADGSLDRLLDHAERTLAGRLPLFSAHELETGAPPQWDLNPFTQVRYPNSERHWTTLPDFVEGFGDIKTVWEASRWDWVLTLARAYRATKDNRYYEALQTWTQDWIVHNPVNQGPNWKCGQESSIRVLNALIAALGLGVLEKPTPGLIEFARLHAWRIESTVRYAMAQDNNHGTSEAAALFIVGSWLTRIAPKIQEATRWRDLGRRWLENRVNRLFFPDGSFAQYSLNYHRVALDAVAMAEAFRVRFGEPAFSANFMERMVAAADWLYAFTDPETGDGPNLGSNDGARLFPLSDTGYRDYRPSTQLAGVVFRGRRYYGGGPADEPLAWFEIGANAPVEPPKRESQIYHNGGFVILRSPSGHSWALIRFASFGFRPAHADVLHVDLWRGSQNVLRDGGTYSYNCPEPDLSYFPGTASHNTVQFDGRDQMPRLGRFLFGDWLKMEHVGRIEGNRWRGSYVDGQGARHEREISVEGDTWTVIDHVSGYTTEAVLRWRLAPGEWRFTGSGVEGEGSELRVDTQPAGDAKLTTGKESRHYLAQNCLSVLEVSLHAPAAEATTTIRLI